MRGCLGVFVSLSFFPLNFLNALIDFFHEISSLRLAGVLETFEGDKE